MGPYEKSDMQDNLVARNDSTTMAVHNIGNCRRTAGQFKEWSTEGVESKLRRASKRRGRDEQTSVGHVNLASTTCSGHENGGSFT